MQCQAILKSGNQCSRKAQSGSKFCWQHQNYETSATHAEGKEEIKTSSRNKSKAISLKTSPRNLSPIKIQSNSGVTVENFHPNGKIKERITYKDSTLKRLDGPLERWYYTGQLEEIEYYKNGLLDGPYKQYYQNGQLFINSNYKNGKLDGLYEDYYENGQLLERKIYKNGQLNGLSEEWRENGQLFIREKYENGKPISYEKY